MDNNKKITIFFIIVITAINMFSIKKTMQNDTFFTIATGNEIIQNGYDNLDHLTWHDNLEFYKLRWSFDVIIATLYNYFGFNGIYFFVVAIACIIEISLFNILTKSKVNPIIAFIMALFSTYLLTDACFLAARGQIISYLLLLLEVFFVEQLIHKKQKRYYIALFLLSVLLVNFHASVWWMMIILILPYLAEAIIYKIFKNKNNSKRIILEQSSIKQLIIAILVITIGSFLSPIGTYTHTYMFKNIFGISSKFISELQMTDILASTGMLSFASLFIGIMLPTKTKIKLSDLLLFLGLYAMGILAMRNQAYMYIIGIIPLARLISEFFNEYDSENILDKSIDLFSKNKSIIVISLIFIVLILTNIVVRSKEEYIDKIIYPVEAVNYIKENIDYKNLRIYNGFNFGSYLEFLGIKAFLDSRSEIFCKEFNDTEILQDWVDTDDGKKHYEDIFTKYNIDYAIIKKDEIINTYLYKDENYNKAYEDEYFIVYTKNMI